MCPRPTALRRRSILDVNGVSEGAVELDSLLKAQTSYGFCFKVALGQRYDVVASDHACLWQTFVDADLDFRTDVADRSGDGRTRDRNEHLNRRVPGEDADGTAAGWRTEVGPDHIAPCYHSGAVRAARRRAAVTSAGSCGTRR
jgi:hypothetical protein